MYKSMKRGIIVFISLLFLLLMSGTAFADELLPAMQGLDVQIDMSNKTMVLDWENYREYCDHYLVAVATGEKDGQPYFYQSIKNRTSVSVPLPEGKSQFTVEISYFRYNGSASQVYRRTVDLKPISCQIGTDTYTSSAQAEIIYQSTGNVNADIYVNDQMQSVQLSGSGKISINLKEFQNEIRAVCKIDDMTAISYQWEVYSDRIPPKIRLFENVDGIEVREPSFILSGEADGAEQVVINGESVSLSEHYVFQKEIILQEGENILEVSAVDVAGNKASVTVSLFHGQIRDEISGEETESIWLENWLPAIFALFLGTLGVLVVLLTLLVLEKRAKKKGAISRGVETVIVLRNLLIFSALASLVLTGWFTFQVLEQQNLTESMNFLNIAEKSVSGAYEMLQELNRYKKLRVLSIVAGIISVVWGILMEIIRKMQTRLEKTSK